MDSLISLEVLLLLTHTVDVRELRAAAHVDKLSNIHSLHDKHSSTKDRQETERFISYWNKYQSESVLVISVNVLSIFAPQVVSELPYQSLCD